MKEDKNMYFKQESLNPSAIDEVRMWTELLAVLTKGLPVPFNPAKLLVKMTNEAQYYPEIDFDPLLKCCYQISEINEVRHFKPIIQDIINRIIDITGVSEEKIKLHYND